MQCNKNELNRQRCIDCLAESKTTNVKSSGASNDLTDANDERLEELGPRTRLMLDGFCGFGGASSVMGDAVPRSQRAAQTVRVRHRGGK